jgi:hypothetical protein
MAKKAPTATVIHKEPVKKRTSIGHGLRKRSSFKRHGEKPYGGQGKG